MFVINLTKKDLDFRAHGEVLILKKGLNKVDDKIFNAGELKNHFGISIAIVNEGDIEEVKGSEEAPQPIAPQENINHEYQAKLLKAEEYLKDIELDDDSDKHAKLNIKNKLQEEASKEDKTYDAIGLVEEIEAMFAKLSENKKEDEVEDKVEDKVSDKVSDKKEDKKEDKKSTEDTTKAKAKKQSKSKK